VSDAVVTSTADLLNVRQQVIGGADEQGRTFCHRLAAATDDWLAALHRDAVAAHPGAPACALVAIGGYGRGELAPFSDLDVLLVHESDPGAVEEIAAAIWYPIWDAGISLGHAVRTLDDQLELAVEDLDTATSLLTARHLAGDVGLASRVAAAGEDNWRRHRDRWLDELRGRVRRRQSDAGDVAYILEPDVKDGHGGIRDAQSLWWASVAGLALHPDDSQVLNDCYDVLLGARVALHRATGRRGDVLRLEDQDATAARSGHDDADALMADIAAAARTVAWIADETWGRLGRRVTGRFELIAPGVILVDGEIELDDDASPATDPRLVLRVAQAAARHEARIGRRCLDRLTDEMPDWPQRWPAGAVDDLVALLLEGHRAIGVLEALDQRGLLQRMLPEWAPVRSRPQRNAYHRFTVDRHLWEATANAADVADRVRRPDLLVLGALFHDIGKGYPGEHTEVGVELLRTSIGPRLGLTASDSEVVVTMIEHHLLLPDVAVRRDLSDPVTIAGVAEQVGDGIRLELLHALTEADSLATGPSAWGSWKAGLVRELAARVDHVLGGGDVDDVVWRLFPDADTLALMASGETAVRAIDDVVTVVAADTPGMFARVAGALALHGLDVIGAQAHSDEPTAGMAMGASQFKVVVPRAGVEWGPVIADVERAVAGGLAITARLAEQARTYRRRRATQARPPGPPKVVFDDGASSDATVVEVHCASKIGVLYRITSALAEVGLDIRHATVQTVGMSVVDTFYVRTRDGSRVTDVHHRGEIERAILHAVA
jgi:[protein-PII] uridylyltransferase